MSGGMPANCVPGRGAPHRALRRRRRAPIIAPPPPPHIRAHPRRGPARRCRRRGRSRHRARRGRAARCRCRRASSSSSSCSCSCSRSYSSSAWARISRYSGHVAQQLVVAPVGDDPATLHHHHAVGEADGREAVGDDQRGPAAHERAQRAVDLELTLGVDRARRVVEHQDARVHEQGARDGDALALAARRACSRARRSRCRSRRTARG